MTLFALAGPGGSFGASGFEVAPSSSPESATAPNPFPARHNRSRRVMFLVHIQKLIQVEQPARQLRLCRPFRPETGGLPLNKLFGRGAFLRTRFTAQHAPPRLVDRRR